MRNEFVYFAKSIPRWITVASDSRCIKAATDKFPPGGAQKTAFSRRRGWIWSLVAPRSISLGRHGSRCWIPIVRRPRVHTRAPHAREDAPSARSTIRDNARGLHIVVYIYASRHKSSFKSHSAGVR
ncbi:hypothetical protein ALC53_05277 [Atta colombica]|uniref:Uncharacterized protein n=1 Tax=Atta colombica TaxID=520822 RepID=A0A195BJ74_9HYME|nr:hypothetical protein ALC53_05277 [Atta colombica]